jgi:hypothetical protein
LFSSPFLTLVRAAAARFFEKGVVVLVYESYRELSGQLLMGTLDQRLMQQLFGSSGERDWQQMELWEGRLGGLFIEVLLPLLLHHHLRVQEKTAVQWSSLWLVRS